MNLGDRWGMGGGGIQIKALRVQTDFDFGHIVSASTLPLTSHARLLSAS